MAKLLCMQCGIVYSGASAQSPCPQCDLAHQQIHDYSNSDETLRTAVPEVLAFREQAGLEGMVGDLACVIVNTEPGSLGAAVQEFLNTTGYALTQQFQDSQYQSCVLQRQGSADFVFRCRRAPSHSFFRFNAFPKSEHLPNTRLETVVFDVEDIDRYVAVHRARGVQFEGDIQRHAHYDFIATLPLPSTGTAVAVIQWKINRGDFSDPGHRPFHLDIEKSRQPYLSHIRHLDHMATRVRARDRDAAILEFMRLTNYHFDFAIYVKSMNSITNVARLTQGRFSMVFTSGIQAYVDDGHSGPTEKFIHNYGTRVHHLAFHTEHIDTVFEGLKAQGQRFLIDLIGSPEEGLKQTFSEPSPHTLLVNEYIHRYGDFDGFFTKNNVTALTGATDRQ